MRRSSSPRCSYCSSSPSHKPVTAPRERLKDSGRTDRAEVLGKRARGSRSAPRASSMALAASTARVVAVRSARRRRPRASAAHRRARVPTNSAGFPAARRSAPVRRARPAATHRLVAQNRASRTVAPLDSRAQSTCRPHRRCSEYGQTPRLVGLLSHRKPRPPRPRRPRLRLKRAEPRRRRLRRRRRAFR
jgi:hypothetical protein